MLSSVSLLALTHAGCSEAPKPSVTPGDVSAEPWVVPADVTPSSPPNPSQADWYDLGWQTFVALNWPAMAPGAAQNAGQPDTSQGLGATAPGASGVYTPTVWLTYRSLENTMLEAAADPGAWNSVIAAPPASCAAVPPGSVAPGFQPMVLNMTAKQVEGTGIDFIDEASGNPLIDQRGWYVLYDIRMSQSEYSYIQTNKYYDGSVQKADIKAGDFVGFPRTGEESMFDPPLPLYAQFGALEIKAAWRVLDPSKDDVSRYYTQQGYFVQPDGTTCEGSVLFGLIVFHILRLTPTTPATWYWATFEQVDNVSVPPGSNLSPTLAQVDTPNGACTNANNVPPPPVCTSSVCGDLPWNDGNTPVDVCRVTTIPDDIMAVNAAWQSAAPVQGTVWQNYQLVGTINPSVQGGPAFSFPNNTQATVNVGVLANASMETYSQTNTQTPSCMSCHGFAAPQGAPSPLTSSYQIFTFLLGNAASSQSAENKP